LKFRLSGMPATKRLFTTNKLTQDLTKIKKFNFQNGF